MSNRELRVLVAAAVIALAMVGAIKAGRFIWGPGEVRVSASGSAGPLPVRVDINEAAAHELDMLPGVGPATAEAIIRSRREDGPFRSLEDLTRVRGIGRRTVENLRPHAMCRPPGERD